MNLTDQTIEIIASTLGVDTATITPQLAAGDIEQWDSMGNMAIIANLEEKLGIEFPLENLFELNSVETIVKEVHRLK